MQFLEGAGQRKTLAPFLNIEEGTRVVCKCYTRGATPIVFQSRKRKTTCCWLLYCVGTAHLFLLALCKVRLQQAFFGQPLTKAF
jgi:hypothetical protein